MKLTAPSPPAAQSDDTRGMGCHLTQSAGQSIIDTSSPEILLWDTETYDDLGFHNTTTNTSRITVPADVSRLLVCCITSTVDKPSLAGTDYVELLINGSVGSGESAQDWLVETDVGPLTPAPNFAHPFNVSEGDYFELQFYIDDTTARLMDTNKTWFACVVLRN